MKGEGVEKGGRWGETGRGGEGNKKILNPFIITLF